MSDLFPVRRELADNSVKRFGYLEKQHSDILSKSPSELAALVMSKSSSVNLEMIQKIKSMSQKPGTLKPQTNSDSSRLLSMDKTGLGSSNQ